jgi:receptor-binding and translocation channel-forming TcA subunit of Tc toxin
MLKSSIRTTPVLRDGAYAREDAEDDRFNDYFGSLQSIVTSSGQTDAGMFETNLRDERYLPFENSGVVTEWQLELPANPSNGDPCQFDYATISDVILHVRYTAREGGALLRRGARANLKTLMDEGRAAGSARLFSVRHEFPTEWAKFQTQTPAAGQRFELVLNLRPEHYPFWSQGHLDTVKRLDLLARTEADTLDVFENSDQSDVSARKDSLVKQPGMGNLLIGRFTGGLSGLALPEHPTGQLKLFFDALTLDELWIVVTFGR